MISYIYSFRVRRLPNFWGLVEWCPTEGGQSFTDARFSEVCKLAIEGYRDDEYVGRRKVAVFDTVIVKLRHGLANLSTQQ